MNWPRRRVVVTGGASFIGSHLVEKLVDLGATVNVVDDFSSGEINNLQSILPEVEIVEGDLRDKSFASAAIERDTDIVFHLAASHGGRGYIDTHPAECCMNMALDQIVFDAAREADAGTVCFASSACVYPADLQEQGNRTSLKEDQATTNAKSCAFPDREYGWAKLMAEMTLQAYHKQYGMKTSSVRIFSAYGERENETHAVMALIAKSLIKMDPFEIWGTGEEDRNFTYVKDIVDALILAADRIVDGTPVNAGTSEHVKIKNLASEIFDIVGWSPSRILFNAKMPVGVFSRAASLERAERLLGWRPRWNLHQGLEKTISWYYSNKDAHTIRRQLGNLLFENRVGGLQS